MFLKTKWNYAAIPMICSACPSFHSFKVAEVVVGAIELELAQKNLEGDGYLQVERKFIHLT